MLEEEVGGRWLLGNRDPGHVVSTIDLAFSQRSQNMRCTGLSLSRLTPFLSLSFWTLWWISSQAVNELEGDFLCYLSGQHHFLYFSRDLLMQLMCFLTLVNPGLSHDFLNTSTELSSCGFMVSLLHNGGFLVVLESELMTSRSIAGHWILHAAEWGLTLGYQTFSLPPIQFALSWSGLQ